MKINSAPTYEKVQLNVKFNRILCITSFLKFPKRLYDTAYAETEINRNLDIVKRINKLEKRKKKNFPNQEFLFSSIQKKVNKIFCESLFIFTRKGSLELFEEFYNYWLILKNLCADMKKVLSVVNFIFKKQELFFIHWGKI